MSNVKTICMDDQEVQQVYAVIRHNCMHSIWSTMDRARAALDEYTDCSRHDSYVKIIALDEIIERGFSQTYIQDERRESRWKYICRVTKMKARELARKYPNSVLSFMLTVVITFSTALAIATSICLELFGIFAFIPIAVIVIVLMMFLFMVT